MAASSWASNHFFSWHTTRMCSYRFIYWFFYCHQRHQKLHAYGARQQSAKCKLKALPAGGWQKAGELRQILSTTLPPMAQTCESWWNVAARLNAGDNANAITSVSSVHSSADVMTKEPIKLYIYSKSYTDSNNTQVTQLFEHSLYNTELKITFN